MSHKLRTQSLICTLRPSWRSLCMAGIWLVALLPLGWAMMATPMQAQAQQSYWLGHLDGTEYVFDTRLPADFAAMMTASDPKYSAFRDLPEFSTEEIDGTAYSFVTTEFAWDREMIDNGQIAFRRNGAVGQGSWFSMDKNSAEWSALTSQLKEEATVNGTWKYVKPLVLIAPNAETPTVRMSIFGAQERYWLGRPDGADYVFDTPLPPSLAKEMIGADPSQYSIDQNPRDFPPLTASGSEYRFVKVEIAYDKPQLDRGRISLVSRAGMFGAKWLDGHLNSAVGEPLAEQLPVPAQGQWESVDMVILISPHAETLGVRVPIPDTTLAKMQMIDLGQQTTAGLYYPAVKIPAELGAFQNQMLAYTNAGRRDPYFRRDNGAKTVTDFSGDTVQTIAGTEKVYKQRETPPYFDDLTLGAELNRAAQFQAEYQASINRLGHGGPSAYRNPQTGQTVNMAGLGQRIEFFGAPAGSAEAAGTGALGNYPHNWMVSDTHFRAFFDVNGVLRNIGFGAAMAADGTWYFVAVAYGDDGETADSNTSTPAQSTPAATSTPDPTPEPTPAPTQTPPAEGEWVSLQSSNFPDRFIRHSNLTGRIDPISSDTEKIESTFRLVRGLADANHISLESYAEPGYFLVVDGSDVILGERLAGDAQFDERATFIQQPGLSDSALLSLESYAEPGQYVRHSGYILYIGTPDGSNTFRSDATFTLAAPNWVPATEPADAQPAAQPAVVTTEPISTATHTAESGGEWTFQKALVDEMDVVADVVWSPSGEMLAAISVPSVYIWDVEQEATIATLGLIVGGDMIDVPFSIAWSPDGSRLAAGSSMGYIHIWDTETWELDSTTQIGGQVYSIAWSPDGSQLAAGGYGVSVYTVDTANVELLPDLQGSSFSVTWSPDGSQLAAGTHGSVYVWDAPTWATVTTIPSAAEDILSITWSPDGATVLAALRNSALLAGDATTGTTSSGPQAELDSVYQVAWAGSGTQIAGGTGSGDAVVWDAASWARTLITNVTDSNVYTVGWSPDSQRLAFGTDSGIQIWAKPGQTTSGELNGHLPPPLITYTYTEQTTQTLPGASTEDSDLRGCSGEILEDDTIGQLAVVLISSQNACWTDGEYNHSGYQVEQGEILGTNGTQLDAYKLYPPTTAPAQFSVSPHVVYYQFPSQEAYTIYAFDGATMEKVLDVEASQIVADGYTRLDDLTVSTLDEAVIYVFMPGAEKPSAYTEVAPGVEAALLGSTALGPLVRYDFEVNGTPFDTIRDFTAGPADWGNLYSHTREFFPVPLADQLGIIWQDQEDQAIQLTTVNADLRSQETLALPNSRNEILAAATIDDQGALYYLAIQGGGRGQNSARSATLYKVDQQGTLLQKQSLDTSSSALNISFFGTYAADMRYADGQLGVMVGRRLHTSSDGLQHQSGSAWVFDSSTLQLLNDLKQTSGHSFDNVLTTSSTDKFIGIDLGDNYPRGVHLHKFDSDGIESKVVYTFKTQHGTNPRSPAGRSYSAYSEISRSGTTYYQWSNDNNTYTELGGVVEGQNGYTVVFAGETGPNGQSLLNSRAVSELNDPRNIGLVQVKPDFNTGDDVVLTEGIDEEGGFYTFGGNWSPQQHSGIVWLTDYADKDEENVSRLKTAQLPDGNILLIWEKWTAETYVNTYAMKITESGTKLTEPVELGTAVRLGRRDDPLMIGDTLYLVGGDKETGTLILVMLEL